MSLTYFVEGLDERSPETMLHNHCEFRFTGPFIKEISVGYYRVEAIGNVVLTNLMEMSRENAYAIVTWAGAFQTAMLEPIPIYKYGTGPDDDGSFIGCMNIKKNKDNAVTVYHMGQIHKTDRIRQTIIDGEFDMWLDIADI